MLLIAGSNAYPTVSLSLPSGSTQVVCMPFDLQANAADADGLVTNVTLLLDGLTVGTSDGSPVTVVAELDSPGTHLLTAVAEDDDGGTRWATQSVAVVSLPLHVLQAAGFRSNGAFKLCMQSETNGAYQVLATDNLSGTNWIPIGLMESTKGIWRFLDFDTTNHPTRFYRVEQLP